MSTAKKDAAHSSRETAMLVCKGFLIGSSMSVPGVSGGTMAILLGIYDRMLRAVSTFFHNVKENGLFLGKVALGGAAGIATLSFVISGLLEKMPVPVSFFFIGVVLGGVPALMREIRDGKAKRGIKSTHGLDSARTIACFILGMICVVAVTLLPRNSVLVQTGLSVQTVISWAVTGIVIALALVLPGISTSHMLLVLGLYQRALDAIRHFNLAFLMLLAGVTLVGVFLITKPLEWLLRKFTWESYSVILGFVIGSLQAVFTEILIPGLPRSADAFWYVYTGLVSVVLFVAGIVFIRAVEQKMKNI